MSRKLKIKTEFSDHKTIKNPKDVSSLLFDVFASAHIFTGIGENFPNLKTLTIGRYKATLEFLERDDFANMRQLKELVVITTLSNRSKKTFSGICLT